MLCMMLLRYERKLKSMSTTKLYQKDVYTREWDAEVTKVTEDGVFLDRTAFFPEGGGQSCDLGTMQVLDADGTACAAPLQVTDVQEAGDDVVHRVSAPDAAGLTPGCRVRCSLDWQRRFDNMQRHCGEHILSGIFYQECGGVNRGFHMGDDYMTIDISLEDEPTAPDRSRPKLIDWETALHCERLANEVVWSNAPVSVFRFDSREEAEQMPLRKKLAFDEDISIVCVGSPEHAADCVACCGTHPSSAGQVGLIKLFKVEKYKEMFRIYFEAGARALRDYDRKHDMLTELSNSYSSSIEDFPDKIRGLEQRAADAKGELIQLKRAMTEIECAALDDALASADANVVVHPLEHFSMEDAFNMAKSYMGKDRCRGRLILLYAKPQTSYILVSDGKIKCGPLVKEYAAFYKGKGGGNDVSARAIFTGEEDAALFADLLRKHLT